MSHTRGLGYEKFDLHLHTPASNDYRDKSATSLEIVNAAIASGLRGIAVTDHQTAVGIDGVKEAAIGTELVVFPGVELNVTGGERGVHVLCIFDVDKDSSYVSSFLNRIRVFQHASNPEVAAEITVGQLADELLTFDPSAILVLAHCHSSKGVTGDMKGEPRTQIFKEFRKNILGAEANESDFTDSNKTNKGTRVIDIFDGTDPNFGYKKLGVYQSSDSHRVADIGKSFSYFKVDGTPTIEDLRQCMIDRDSRIRQAFEYSPESYPKIDSIRVKSGFLDGLQILLHEGLNSVLGAKGSGKSLAIELIRFALNQASTIPEIERDHSSKLEKMLKTFGEVEVELTDESGKKYRLTRIYNPSQKSPYKIVDLIDGSEKTFAIEQSFPVLFLSQNEASRIAEDSTGAAQRRFIDRFFDFYSYQQSIQHGYEELKAIDSRFAICLESHLKTKTLQAELETAKEELAKLGRQITNPIFSDYKSRQEIGAALENRFNLLRLKADSLDHLIAEFGETYAPEDTNIVDPSINRADAIINESINEGFTKLSDLKKYLLKQTERIQLEISAWRATFDPVKLVYEKQIKESGGDAIALDQRRTKVLLRVRGLEAELTKLRDKASGIKQVTETRKDLIAKLAEKQNQYSEERSNRCEFFTQASQGTLKVELALQVDHSQFKSNLGKLKRGSWLRDEDIELLAKNVSPEDFVNALMSFAYLSRTSDARFSAIAAKSGLRTEKLVLLANHLLDEHPVRELLSIMYSSVPEDVPTISYKVAGEFKPLSELSIGQKATALLIIALSDGRFPIVIDQPEDSLDLKSIWEDICTKIRSTKEKRQFLFTTHNSSVAVASDTDKFVVLESTAFSSKNVISGSLNSSDMRQEVIGYLEGGDHTYAHKQSKYKK